MYKKQKGFKKHLDFFFIDIFSLELSLYISSIIRFSSFDNISDSVRSLAAIILLASPMTAFVLNGYHNILKRGYWKEFVRVLKHCIMVTSIVIVYLFFAKISSNVSRVVLAVFFPVSIVVCYAVRLIHKRELSLIIKKRSADRQTMLVCSYSLAEATIEHINSRSKDEFIISDLVVIDRDCKGEKIGGLEVTANIGEISEVLEKKVIDEVYIRTEGVPAWPENVVDACKDMGITYHMVLWDNDEGEAYELEKMAGYTVVTEAINYVMPVEQFVKRAMDIAGGVVGCLLTVILCIFIVPAIKRRDPGPAFYSQIRVGRNGRKFRIYKFRSMYMDADERKKELMAQNEIDGFMFKMENDPRILPGVGHFIRKTSLDEFPQFFNVLRGEMSLVGDRVILGHTKKKPVFMQLSVA